MNTLRHLHEPVWRHPHQPASRNPSSALQGWLLDQSSLTRRLVQRCAGRFQVRRLREGYLKPTVSERALLEIPAGQLAWVREVHLLCGEAPWVFARTVIPMATLQGELGVIKRLGSRPLGAFLFAHPGMRRGPVEVAESSRLFGQAQPLWGRRSLFHLSRRRILVAEYFLPAFEESLQ